MKLIRITPEKAVSAESIDYISKDQDGFGVVHFGIEQLRSNFPYESLLSLMSIENIGNGPNPTSTALTY